MVYVYFTNLLIARLHDSILKSVLADCIFAGMRYFLTSIMAVHLSAYVSLGPHLFVAYLTQLYNFLCICLDFA